ncbi:MAG: hypothetical protein QCH96_05150 [Candidatus Thermoplasmatota archaeon]|nr:hypothetical protein [Candidatus Thermoplasmatota archaeon]
MKPDNPCYPASSAFIPIKQRMYFILILLLLRYCIESNAVTTDRNSKKIRLNKDRKKGLVHMMSI